MLALEYRRMLRQVRRIEHDRKRQDCASQTACAENRRRGLGESKFEEIQKAAEEAFEYVAKHMLADGSGRMLTDEELAEREKQVAEEK